MKGEDIVLLEEYEAKRRAEKLKRWSRLVEEAPQIAELLTGLNKYFGKPKKLAIKFKDSKWELWK